jgi:hypothetical protein
MNIYASRTGTALEDNAASTPWDVDAWADTRVQAPKTTQLVHRSDVGVNVADIGRPVSYTRRELSISCAPGEALQQQFEHLHPEFMVIHDVATRSSRQLLRGIAEAAGRPMQQLALRRQGFGTSVATIDFVEVPVGTQQLMRIYSTDMDDAPDASARHAVARTLLAYSQMGVFMMGAMPAESVTAALRPWRDELLRSPWLNRNLLLLPLTNSAELVTHGQHMVRGSSITLRTSPMVTRPADAWNFINTAWSRIGAPINLRAATSTAPAAKPAEASRPAVPSSGFAPTEILPMRPMPDIAPRPQASVPAPATTQFDMGDEVLDPYVVAVQKLTGVLACCVFDVGSGMLVSHAGTGFSFEEIARQARSMLSTINAGSRALGLGQSPPDMAITLAAHHLVLREVPKHGGMAMVAVLDRATANLTLARLQIERLDPMLDR